MKTKYIHDLFTEGLGDIFFMKVYHLINDSIENDVIKKILIGAYGALYLIFLVIIAYVMFKLSFPL